MKHLLERPADQTKRMSHPAGVRGLKLQGLLESGAPDWVAPRRGAWIETREHKLPSLCALSRTPQGCVD